MANTPASQAQPTKLRWLTICLCFMGTAFIYGLLCVLVINPVISVPVQDLPKMQVAFGSVAVFALIGSVSWMQFKTQVPITQPTVGKVANKLIQEPAGFVIHSIVAMALAELPAIYGLILRFMGASFTTYAIFAAGSLLVLGGVILPRGMAYWNAYEAQQKAAKEPSPFSS
jgi:hypothetical protein